MKALDATCLFLLVTCPDFMFVLAELEMWPLDSFEEGFGRASVAIGSYMAGRGWDLMSSWCHDFEALL